MKFVTAPLLSVALLTTLASCSHTEEALDPSLHGFFPDDVGETRKPNQFIDAQAASAARADAMLYKQHFDGGRLNSLGEAKLADMLRDDDSPTPMTVYLKLDESSQLSKSRQASVVTYLKDLGLNENQITITYGDNPASRYPAAQGLSRMNKTESGAAVGGAADGKSGGNDGGGGAGAGATNDSASTTK